MVVDKVYLYVHKLCVYTVNVCYDYALKYVL
jgi:hypothetical protein